MSGLAFLATAVATLFAQATLVRWTRSRRPHERAWTISLWMFALASAALATGVATGWDGFTYRAFFALGAVLNVPWLGLGTLYLLGNADRARRVEWALVLFTGLALGAVAVAPFSTAPSGTAIPVAKETFDTALPRILAAVGSGLGATVVLVGTVLSIVRRVRSPAPGATRLAAANGLIGAGVLVLSSGGLLQGVLGHDEAFVLTLAVGIVVIYAGFLVAGSSDSAISRNARRSTLPASERGKSSTTSMRDGTL